MTPWDEEKSLYRMELWLDVKEAFRSGWSRGLRDKSRGLHILVQCLLGFKNAFVDYDIPQVEKLSVKRLRQLRLRHSVWSAFYFVFTVSMLALQTKWWIQVLWIPIGWDTVKHAMKALCAHKRIPVQIVLEVHDS